MVAMSRGNCKVRGSQMGIKRTINQKVNLILNRISCTNRASAFVYRFWGLAVSPHFNHDIYTYSRNLLRQTVQGTHKMSSFIGCSSYQDLLTICILL